MSGELLEVRRLATQLHHRRSGWVPVVDDVSLSVRQGEIVGLVGESGCGKSMTAFSIMQLFPTPAARVASGEVIFKGRDLLKLPPDELRKVRGAELGMIFQDPSTFLDPLLTLGDQIAEPLYAHQFAGDPQARTLELIEQMGLPDPPVLARRYPHQVSGGQKQRALIATAMACSPDLLIADEPTTALDVTVQAQILDLMRDLRSQTGAAILLITHDLGVVAEMCDRVYVMYAGRVVEQNTTRGLFRRPRHPYTQGLLNSTISLETTTTAFSSASRLFAIPGTIPGLESLPPGCRFAPRCPIAAPRCREQLPELLPQADARAGGMAACFYTDLAAEKNIWAQEER
jgi:oligopeptide/dipeptide ABC transporter ATP-binding protein